MQDAPSHSSQPTDAQALTERVRGEWRWAAAVFAAVLAVYALTAWDRVLHPSPHFHFVDLAWNLMHGRLETQTPHRRRGERPRPGDPPGYQEAIDRALTGPDGKTVGWNDWASYHVIELVGGEKLRGVWPWKDTHGSRRHEFHTLDGRIYVVDPVRDIARTCGRSGHAPCDRQVFYVSFPPFPAVVMMPLVAVWGYRVNDVAFTLLFAALNAALFFGLLGWLARRGLLQRTRRERLWFTALFALGTVAWFSSIRGEVWFTALVLGLTLNLAYVWAAVGARRPFLAGLFLALGFATRTPLLFASVFFGLELLWPSVGERPPWRRVAGKLALFALPCLAVGGALLAYNAARFGSPFEFGHRYLQDGTRPAIRDHGLFSWWFVNRNLAAMLVNLPVFIAQAPFVKITRHGLSLLVTTPPYALLARARNTTRLWRHLALTALIVALPAVFYQNTGWAQFGYRFSLDWTPFLLVMLALDRPVDRRLRWLIGAAIAVNFFGALTFGRMPVFYFD